MGPFPEVVVDDGVVLSGIRRALVNRYSAVDPVLEQPVEITLVD